MASDSSGSLRLSQPYSLGDYAFTLSAQYDSYEQQTHVIARCVKGTETAQSGKDLSGNIQINSWRVEAEDKTATVYAIKHIDPLQIPLDKPVVCEPEGYVLYTSGSIVSYKQSVGEGLYTNIWQEGSSVGHLIASATSGTRYVKKRTGSQDEILVLGNTFSYGGKTVYYYYFDELRPIGDDFSVLSPVANKIAIPQPDVSVIGKIAWSMIYEAEAGDTELIVTKFEIDIADADGGNWDYPGDTGEPSKTLHITVTGALSGRHNDPLNDTTYHYTPSDREQSNVYGSGGVGGSGGAGGAGASTVIIYSCATDKAGYTEEIAIARRHGYGSGAGKGGKGGDGCILVYY